ncbi:hypothetical protein Tco_0911405 [Tanacetum coccineum]|uniref:Uncharacterized protein n=1 Tax=Tanacetum coccineum TaxID=301880 RepID=A0ABQ5CVP0_9ASTR
MIGDLVESSNSVKRRPWDRLMVGVSGYPLSVGVVIPIKNGEYLLMVVYGLMMDPQMDQTLNQMQVSHPAKAETRGTTRKGIITTQ